MPVIRFSLAQPSHLSATRLHFNVSVVKGHVAKNGCIAGGTYSEIGRDSEVGPRAMAKAEFILRHQVS